jgi:hypothetical protein
MAARAASPGAKKGAARPFGAHEAPGRAQRREKGAGRAPGAKNVARAAA